MLAAVSRRVALQNHISTWIRVLDVQSGCRLCLCYTLSDMCGDIQVLCVSKLFATQLRLCSFVSWIVFCCMLMHIRVLYLGPAGGETTTLRTHEACCVLCSATFIPRPALLNKGVAIHVVV